VVGDAHALQAAVLNLALNAVEAAGRGGVVEVRQADEGHWVRLEVADSGPGPTPEVAAHLGQPFVTTKPEGVGLGLLLVRQVAEEHGGTLEWRRNEGRTVFTLKLPLAPSAEVAVAGVNAVTALVSAPSAVPVHAPAVASALTASRPNGMIPTAPVAVDEAITPRVIDQPSVQAGAARAIASGAAAALSPHTSPGSLP
jgi:anti-sigma regulatory factor (Ser/Thr protein kinase)